MKSLSKIFILLIVFIFESTSKGLEVDSSFYIIQGEGENINNILKENKSKYLLSSSDTGFSIENTYFQNTIKKDVINDKLTSLFIECGKISRAGKSEKDLNNYLINTRILNYNSAIVKFFSKNFLKSKNPLKEIPQFVYTYISDKKTGSPFNDAPGILKSRSGDCTEHAVLTAALFRANKIPCRALVGVIFTENWSKYPGKKNIFVYHMWNEVFFKGKWHLVDSTRPGDINENRYIAFTYHSLKTESPLSYLEAISAIKNLKIKYIHEN